MATGGGRIERGGDFGRSEKGQKEPDFWRAAHVGNKGLDRESQFRMKTAPTDAPFAKTSGAVFKLEQYFPW